MANVCEKAIGPPSTLKEHIVRPDLGVSTSQLWLAVARLRHLHCVAVWEEIEQLELHLMRFASDCLPIAEPHLCSPEFEWALRLVDSWPWYLKYRNREVVS